MYETYWGLTIKPFQNTPDPRFIYYTTQYQSARLKLEYAIKEELGAAVLSGVFGCGKTTLLFALLKELNPEKYRVAYIAHPILDQLELMMSIVSALGETNLPQKRNELLRNVIFDRLRNILMNHLLEGKKTVVIIDEAHLLTEPGIFEELRLLLNFQLEDRFLLTLILSGQPDLQHKIETLPQLEQRINIKCHLTNLNREDTELYILHRLKIAGLNQSLSSLFTPAAIDRIYEYSGGIPRRINRLCDLALLAGFIHKLNLIDEKVIEEQAQSLTSAQLTPPLVESAPKTTEKPKETFIKTYSTETTPSLKAIPKTTPKIPCTLPKLDDENSIDLYRALLLLAETFFNQVNLGKVINIQSAVPLINRVVEKIISGDHTLLALAIKTPSALTDTSQNYLATHSVNIAIMAIHIGLTQKQDKSTLVRLSLAGLLHDIGMIEPQLIPTSARPLTPQPLLTGEFETKPDSVGGRYLFPSTPVTPSEEEIITLTQKKRLSLLVYLVIILILLSIFYIPDLFSFRTTINDLLGKWIKQAISRWGEWLSKLW